MAPTLDIAASNTDCVSRASNNHHSLSCKVRVQVMFLYTSGKSYSSDTARGCYIGRHGRNEVIDNSDIFHLVRRNLQRIRCGRTAEEIMARVFDSYFDVVLHSKVHSGLYVFCCLYLCGVERYSTL